jgi:hypothetical protein
MLAYLLLPALAWAEAQTLFETRTRGGTTTFDVAWTDAARRPQAVTFALPKKDVERDKDALTEIPRPELYRAMAAAVESWAHSLPAGTTVTPNATNDEIAFRARGPKDQAQKALAEAHRVAQAAEQQWLADHDATTLSNGALAFDHAALAAEYAREVRPIADALRRKSDTPRAYVERALSFVQSIPYEARGSRSDDTGYRRPLGVLARNKGDCDSKSVLFLALVRAAYPEVPLAFLYIPNHALVGVGLPAHDGDDSFVVGDVRYLFAEPVGPGLRPFGQPAPDNREAVRSAEIRLVPSSA